MRLAPLELSRRQSILLRPKLLDASVFPSPVAPYVNVPISPTKAFNGSGKDCSDYVCGYSIESSCFDFSICISNQTLLIGKSSVVLSMQHIKASSATEAGGEEAEEIF